MRSAVAAATCALVLSAGLGLTACGGDDQPVDQIPKSTPALLPPDDANELAAGGTSGGTTTTDTTTDTTATDTGGTTDTGAGTGTGTGTGGTATPDTGTGGTGTGGTDGTATPDTGGQAAPNPGGVTPDETAGAGSFQGFCDSNPGAC